MQVAITADVNVQNSWLSAGRTPFPSQAPRFSIFVPSRVWARPSHRLPLSWYAEAVLTCCASGPAWLFRSWQCTAAGRGNTKKQAVSAQNQGKAEFPLENLTHSHICLKELLSTDLNVLGPILLPNSYASLFIYKTLFKTLCGFHFTFPCMATAPILTRKLIRLHQS